GDRRDPRRCLSHRLAMIRPERRWSWAWRAYAMPRYERYKSPARRYTHDTLDGQNGAFGERLLARTPATDGWLYDRPDPPLSGRAGRNRSMLTALRGCCWVQLIVRFRFLATDRSRSHGHAP